MVRLLCSGELRDFAIRSTMYLGKKMKKGLYVNTNIYTYICTYVLTFIHTHIICMYEEKDDEQLFI